MVANLKKITPEEKLLHLIENSGSGQNKSSLKKNVGKKRKLINFKPVNFPNVFSGFFLKLDMRKIGLKTVNKILIGVSLALSIIFLFQWAKEKVLIQKRFNALEAVSSTPKDDRLDLQQTGAPDAADYIAVSEKNNPFHLLPVKEEEMTTEITLATEFKLVGILWSDQAQAIIEDSSSEQTFLVSEGDTIDKYTIVKITKTEVTLHADDGDKILQ